MFGEKSILRSWLLKFIVTVVLLTAMNVSAVPPSWWSQADSNGRRVTAPVGTEPDNYGVANIGQAKFMAKRAIQALRVHAPSVANEIEGALVGDGKAIENWTVPLPGSDTAKEQYSPLRVGQLKQIAAPFYTKLNAYNPVWLRNQLRANKALDSADSANYFPWTSSTTDDSNKAIATIGQLKTVFSLHFESVNGPSVPLNVGTAPRLSVAGNLLVKVTNPDGSPVGGVLLQFTRMSGDGSFPGGVTNLSRTTNTSGEVSAADYTSPLGDVIRVTLNTAEGTQTAWLPANVSVPSYVERSGSGGWNFIPPTRALEGRREPEVETHTDDLESGPPVESILNYVDYEATSESDTLSDPVEGAPFRSQIKTEIKWRNDGLVRKFNSSHNIGDGWVAQEPWEMPDILSPQDHIAELFGQKWHEENEAGVFKGEVTSRIVLKGRQPSGYRNLKAQIGYVWVDDESTATGVATPQFFELKKTGTDVKIDITKAGGQGRNTGSVVAVIGPFICSGPPGYGDTSLNWGEIENEKIVITSNVTKTLTAEILGQYGNNTQSDGWIINSSNENVRVNLVHPTIESDQWNVEPSGSSDGCAPSKRVGFRIRNVGSNDEDSTITLTCIDGYGATIVEKTFEVTVEDTSQNESPTFKYGENPLPVTVPIEESSGPKYRKIALDGSLISDEKPQAEGEGDEEDEETYVDALSRELRHSTTDVYVPVPGSDLALTVRRNATSEIWNATSGLLPKEDPTLVFGPAWRSNLGANIRIVEQLERQPLGYDGLPIQETVSNLVAKVPTDERKIIGVSQTDPNYAFVTDENGCSYRFLIGYIQQQNESTPPTRFFVPAPTAVNEKDSYEMSLTFDGGNLVFKKRYGNTLVFQPCIDFRIDRVRGIYPSPGGLDPGETEGVLDPGVSETAVPPSTTGIIGARGNGQLQDYRYFRLFSVSDRLGTRLDYGYLGTEDIIPASISVAGRPELAIHIQATDGKVRSVFDPKGNETRYEYSNPGVAGNPSEILKKVIVGSNPITTYGYKRWFEEDPKMFVISSNGSSLLSWAETASGPFQYQETTHHLDLSSIADAAGNTVHFTYKQDKSHLVRATSRFAESIAGSLRDGGECTQTYAAAGYPPDVTRIDLPGGDVVKIGSSSEVPPVPPGVGLSLPDADRHTTVLDAAGNRRTYSWADIVSVDVNQQELGYEEEAPGGGFGSIRDMMEEGMEDTMQPNATGSMSVFTYFNKMVIQHDSGGTETYKFDHRAGCALKSVQDFSGNMTYFDHGESDGPGSPKIQLTDKPGGIMPLYSSKPTSQKDARGRIRKFIYGDQGMLRQNHDHNNHITDYGVDTFGRTTRERTTSGGTTLGDTEIVYHSNTLGTGTLGAGFPGFISRRTVKNVGEFASSSDPAWVQPLTQLYEPDANGRVSRQATDMNGSNAIDAGDLITSFTYDRNGNKLSETNPSGLTTWFHYDGRNRLVGVTYPDGTEKKTVYDARGKKVLEYDEKGNASGFVYDVRGRLVKTIRDMNGNLANSATGLVGIDPGTDLITEMVYNAVNLVTRVKDPRGYISVTDYDHLQRPVRKITPGPSWPAGSVPTATSANQVTSFYYDGPNSGSSSFDSSGFKPTRTVDPRGYTSVFAYDELYRLTESRVQYSLSPARFAQTVNAYDAVSGGISDAYEKRQPTDVDGTPLAGTWGAQRHVHTTYDSLYRPNKVTTYDATGDAETTTSHTATGLVKQTTRKLTAATTAVTDMEYDRAGRLVKTIAPAVPLDGTATMVRPETSMVYSPTGSVIQTTDARGNVTRSVHDARERLLQTIAPAVYDAESQQGNRPSTSTNTYDKVGNVVAVTNARGYSTLTSYDAANRAVQVSLPTYRDPLTQSDVTPTTINEYDLAGNPVKVTDANGSVTINTYDPLNRVTSTKTNPTVPASTSSHADDQIVAFEWDKAGNKTKVTDGLAQVTSFQYDGKNRLTATIWDSDDSTRIRTDTTEYDALVATATVNQRPVRIEHAYNARLLLTGSTCTQLPGDNETRTYDNAGRLLTVNRTGAGDLRNVTYTYDASDRMTSETSAGSTHSYGYDPVGNRTLVQYSTGRKLATAYDSQNRVATITESVTGNAATRETGYQYDLAGNVLIRSQANGTREYSGYNAAGRRVSQSTVRGTTPVSDFAYFHAPGGNLLRIDETYGSTSVPDRNVINTYDRQNRLLTEKAETLNSSHAVTKSVLTTYAYNKGDNRTSKNVTETQGATVVSNKTETSVYGSSGNGTNSNQLHSLAKDGQTSTYTYDASGNRKTKSVGGVLKETYGWDSKNRLVSLVQYSPSKTFSYGYDYRARRVIRDESAASGENTAVSFSGGTSAFEKVGTTVKVEYVRGSDYGGGIGGIMYTVRSGVNSFNAYNSRGDVVAKTTDAGTVTWQATYESFGTRTTETGTNPDRQKANTKEEDPTGLLNEGFRYRDLVTGSFISRDPLGFVDGPNVYTYVRQNPWTSFDPLGLASLSEESPSDDEIKNRIQNLQGEIDSQWTKYKKDLASAEAAGISRAAAADLGKLRGVISSLSAKKAALNSILEARAEIGEDGFGTRKAYSIINQKFGLGQTQPSESLLSWFKPEGGFVTSESWRSLSRGIDTAGKISVEGSMLLFGAPAAGRLPSAATQTAKSAPAVADGTIYSTAFEMKLNPVDFGRSRSVHFNRANAALDNALKTDAGLATRMEGLIPGVQQAVSRVGGRETPAGWIWHHEQAEGLMRLVPGEQHTPGSIFWKTMHPEGRGGYSIWAIPNGAPPN